MTRFLLELQGKHSRRFPSLTRWEDRLEEGTFCGCAEGGTPAGSKVTRLDRGELVTFEMRNGLDLK